MKFVYKFSEGTKEMKALLGGKGANLAEMSKLGLPVPKGFTVTTAACVDYLEKGQRINESVNEQILSQLVELEETTGKVLGSVDNPLLVSVRSGSVFSMPGMMDTILNLGLNDDTVETLSKATGNERFAYDCYRRLLQMFGNVVLDIDSQLFESAIEKTKEAKNYKLDSELTGEDWKQMVESFKQIYKDSGKGEFPQDPKKQLFLAIEAVFRSWLNARAITYRRLHGISEKIGTAVNIQEMVFGNTGEQSGTGVAFTRNPVTGEKGLFGEFLLNAQGEDVVAGIRTPSPIIQLAGVMPEVYDEFVRLAKKLEKHYRDMQDIEFTIENRKLYLLQTRDGKRTPQATCRIAVDMVGEELIDKGEALLRIQPDVLNQLLHPTFSPEVLKQAHSIARGLPASPGAATGKVYFDALAAKEAKESGEDVILVRQETSPEDIEGMVISEAIVTSRGGMTSHAAVVARGMGTCCVVGCEDFKVSEQQKVVQYDGGTLHEGDEISVDGGTGQIFTGILEKSSITKSESLQVILEWAKEISKIGIRANAETVKEINRAVEFGCDGIGLIRTEHMFFNKERIFYMRKMILADSVEARKEPLEALKQMQKEDFINIYRAIKDKPATVRLLDPPLHEFLPQIEEDIVELSESLNMSRDTVEFRIEELKEVNPMLGHRGCRLAITSPEIYQMQVEAIIEAALEVRNEIKLEIVPEIMVPLVSDVEELKNVKALIVKSIEEVTKRYNQGIEVKIGSMIETPRACLMADELAQDADFFSFGTNDLTQMTFGFSRDDIAKFIDDYQIKKILERDPFQVLDMTGVGQLIKIAVEKGRAVKENLKIGVCGEVGGDPASIQFFQDLGLNYISCSPFRIPVARLTAARNAVLKGQKEKVYA